MLWSFFIWLRRLLSFKPREVLFYRHGQFSGEFVLPWWHRCEFEAQDVGWLMPTQTRRRCALFFCLYTKCLLQRKNFGFIFSTMRVFICGVLFVRFEQQLQTSNQKIFFQEDNGDLTKKNMLVQNELANTYFMKAEQTSQSMVRVRGPSVLISFDRVRRNQCSNDVSEFSSEVHWTFSTPVASGIIPKSHLLWLQVNTSHLSTTRSRSLVVLDVELNLKWWHLVYILCPFLSVTPNKVGWRILGYTTYTTYITKIQTRLTCCCTLEKFSVFLCITGPYTLKSEIWQVVDIRGWGLSIALLPKQSNNTLSGTEDFFGFNDFNVCFKRTILTITSSHHFPHLNDYSHLQAWNA